MFSNPCEHSSKAPQRKKKRYNVEFCALLVPEGVFIRVVTWRFALFEVKRVASLQLEILIQKNQQCD